MKFLALIILAITCSRAPITKKYDRKDWKHWSDVDKDCLNTRNEILIERSLIEVKTKKKGCKVTSGKWEDYYYPEFHYSARQVDIDHLVPLKNANESGGDKWSSHEKEAFANDPENLVITDLKYNRKKGSKGIDRWLPVHPEFACKYIKDWIKIKTKYHLTILEGEAKTIEAARAGRCNFN